MANFFGRLFGRAKAAVQRVMEVVRPVKGVIEEVIGPILIPDDARLTSSLDRLGEGEEIAIGMYTHPEQRASMRHDPKTRTLFVRYPVGRLYAYRNVDRAMAHSMLRAGQNRQTPAAGTWVWDHLRVRGSRTGHQKEYREITGGSFPGWGPVA